MAGRRNRRRGPGPIYAFGITWLILSGLFPLYELWGLLVTVSVCSAVSILIGRYWGRKEQKAEEKAQAEAAKKAEEARKAAKPKKKSYGPEIDAILEESDKALREMGRIYMSIDDPELRAKINELMRITDKIAQDAIADPSDVPQIKKFFNYYMPTTIKLLNTYDRMRAQGIEGENLDKSMRSINEMLDAAIVAFKKRLDSLFENQALDIETDIEVMNKMLAREGLSGTKDFEIK